MKIAIFSDCYLDLTGGIVTTINAEKAELEKRGHLVYVFSSAYPHSKVEKKKLACAHIYPVPSCKVFGRGATPIARRPKIVEKWLQKNYPEIKDFDIFYVHYEAGCSIAGLRLAKKLGIPSVQVMHGREDVGEAKLIPFGLRTFVATMLNWFHSWYLPHKTKIHRDGYLAKTIASAKMWTLMVNHANFADLVITPSENFRNMLLRYGVTREMISLHHGVPDSLVDEPAKVKKLTPGEPLKMIWHSRVSGEKRIMPFLAALRLVGNGYFLDVYGDGPDLPRARAYVKAHHMKVRFHGNTDYAEIHQKLQTAHLDILASYNYDTFGMILIEAEAAGIPVFIADPALTEIVPADSYILSISPTSADMAAGINNILARPELIENMSRAMLKSRKNVRISIAITKLEKIFKKLAKNY